MIEAVIVSLALVLDIALGDPKSRYHPTAWIGSLIALLVPLAKRTRSLEKPGGVLVVITAVSVVVVPLVALDMALEAVAAGVVLGAITGVILFKTTIAVRGMERHALDVVCHVERGDLESARASLSCIVKRSTAGLDQRKIISGVLESISENTTDGVTGPMFYYALLGLPGAFAYRVVNTADSMIGYKTPIFRDVGWFAAKCDTVLNYVPSRLTGLVMIVSAALLQNDWRGSYKTMLRDGRNTQSPNAGYPMAALAGALQTRLEKTGCYALDGGAVEPTVRHVREAIRMMRLTSALFLGMVAIPIIAALYLAGWYVHA
ncbi:MAG: cobalamin biosynthesis protein [Nitrosopumilus sp. H8]|nr:MAG: cobalamin biosynthesis protein [Nitrosopumilus sp. H13]RNJ80161.1 MAG: cobalamin biosynthesis protein [Nitrosopumilus sp. H8]